MIGIIGAMEIETRGIKNLMCDVHEEKYASITFSTGKIHGKAVVCAMCNPGKINAAACAQIMIMKYSPEIIINSGVAGSLSDELSILDVAVATSCVQHDFDTSALGSPKGMVEGVNMINFECSKKAVDTLLSACSEAKTGVIASGDIFVSGEAAKKEISNTFNAIACEMEGGAIGHICYINNVDYGVLRVISDGADEMDFNTFKVKASEKSIEIMNQFIRLY